MAWTEVGQPRPAQTGMMTARVASLVSGKEVKNERNLDLKEGKYDCKRGRKGRATING